MSSIGCLWRIPGSRRRLSTLQGLWCNRRLLYRALWMILFILPAIVTLLSRGSLLWLIWLPWLLSFVSHYICSIQHA